jgi:hypothetical protein
MQMKANLGQLGESQLLRWAAEVGLIANRSQNNDSAGWDFLIEWPNATDPNTVTVGSQSDGFIQALVQVKATFKADTKTDVKLTNWQRICRTPLPAFLLLFRFEEGTANLRSASLVHVDEAHIDRVNRRLAEERARRDGRRKLHRQTLSVKWKSDGAILIKSATELRSAVEEIVKNPVAYSAKKISVIQDSERRTSSKILTAEIVPSQPGRDPAEDLLAFALGMMPHLDIAGGTLHDDKSGAEAPPDRVLAAGRLEHVEPVTPPLKGSIVIRRGDEERAELTGDIYVPVGLRHAPGTFATRFRLALRHVDILAPLILDREAKGPYEGDVDFKFRLPKPNEAVTLGELMDVATLVAELSESSTEKSEVEIRCQGAPTGRATLGGLAFPKGMRRLAELARDANFICRAIAPTLDATTTIASLFSQARAVQLSAAALSQPKRFLNVSFSVDVTEATAQWCLPLAQVVRYEKTATLVAAAAIGSAEHLGADPQGGQRYQLVTQEIKVTEARLIRPADTESALLIAKKTVSDAYEKTHNVVILESL